MPTADAYMAALEHPRKPEVEALRAMLRAIAPDETVKWNAPSYADRVTMRLHPGARVELVLHRGAKPVDATGFAFDDPTGRITWAAPDRGVIALAGPADLDDALADLVRRWLGATT